MIEQMQGIARRIYPVRFLFIAVALFCLFAFLYILLSSDPALDPYLFPSVVSFGWSLCLFGVADMFYRVPEGIVEGDRFGRRVLKRIRRMIVWLWSAGFMLCTLMLIYLSYKAFSLALAAD